MLAIEHCHIIITEEGYRFENGKGSSCKKNDCQARLLKKILKVVREDIPYSPFALGSFGGLPPYQQREELHKLASKTYKNNRWTQRSKTYSSKGKIAFCREKSPVIKKEAPQSSFIQIDRLVAPQRFLEHLPNEIIQQILEFLSLKDLKHVAFVNIDAYAHYQTAIIKRAGPYWHNQASYIDPTHYFNSLLSSLNVFKRINLMTEKEEELRNTIMGPAIGGEKSLSLLAGEERKKLEDELYDLLLSPKRIYEIKNCRPEVIVRALINFGLDPNRQDQWGRTALHYAIWIKNTTVAETLLKIGADPNITEEKNISPADLAINQPELLDLLLEWGAKSTGIKNSLLIAAVLNGQYASVSVLLRHRSPANITDTLGQTPLHYAVENNFMEITKNLLLYKAGINTQDNDGSTPIFKCPNNRVMALLLIKNGAEIHHINHAGDTPLHFAAAKGYCDVISILLDAGALPFALNLQEQSPLHLAITSEKAEAMLLLSKRMSEWLCPA